jgi:hypothetical protein
LIWKKYGLELGQHDDAFYNVIHDFGRRYDLDDISARGWVTITAASAAYGLFEFFLTQFHDFGEAEVDLLRKLLWQCFVLKKLLDVCTVEVSYSEWWTRTEIISISDAVTGDSRGEDAMGSVSCGASFLGRALLRPAAVIFKYTSIRLQ